MNHHVLPNGFTFLAASRLYGSWAKGIDPITAIRDVFRTTDGTKNAIWVVYGKNDELKINDYGGHHNAVQLVSLRLPVQAHGGILIKPTKTVVMDGRYHQGKLLNPKPKPINQPPPKAFLRALCSP